MKSYRDLCTKCKFAIEGETKMKLCDKPLFCGRKKGKAYCSTVNCYGDCKHYEEKRNDER